VGREVTVRWEALFSDLEAQFEQAEAAGLSAEVADRTRGELARIRLVDRLRAATGRRLVCTVTGGGTVSGRLLDAGPDWILLSEAPGRDAIVPLAVVLSVTGLGHWAAEPGSEGAVAKRLDLRYVLRAVARDRSPVWCALVDGSTVTGTLDRVGADFVDIAEHPFDEPRRPAAVRAMRSIPLTALAIVRQG
jgi:hypothetical protein